MYWPLNERALVVLSLSGQITCMCALEACDRDKTGK